MFQRFGQSASDCFPCSTIATNKLTNRQKCFLSVCLFVCLFGCLFVRLFVCLVGWLVGWLVG